MSSWHGESNCLDGLPKGDDPVSMGPDGLGLLWNSNGDLEEFPKVLGLLSLDISGVVGPKDLGKVDCKPLDNVEPLVWRESLGIQVRGGSS